MTTRKNPLRIGNASGYWGDDPQALYRQISGGPIDYISMDFLAEVTMSIMQKQRRRDSQAGYARDFVSMLKEVLPLALKNGTKIISNAGGVNPISCAKAIRQFADELGLKPKIALVMGDDILDRVKQLNSPQCPFRNMESQEDFAHVKDRLEAANVYFGATPVVEALKWNPDIVITGRVTDTGITLAPMIHEFGWSLKDWDKLASGIVAGHLMECGAQATGGNFTDWEKVPNFINMGYPIAEVNPDGSFILTKHSSQGGYVSTDTVREQLFYEMGDPKAYITPDVVADFSSIQIAQDGPNRVKVFGVKGFEPTPFYKVSMAFNDGYKSVGMIIISGDNARKKAETFSKIFWERCGTDFKVHETEYFGWNACHRSLGQRDDGNEILLRLGVLDNSLEKLNRFGKLIPSLILSGPPGVTVVGGVPKPQDVVSYWPALMPKSLVNPSVALYSDQVCDLKEVHTCLSGDFKLISSDIQIAKTATSSVEQALKTASASKDKFTVVTVRDLCLGRSGDKGDTCNVGIMARSRPIFDYLDQFLTAQVVKNWFQELCFGQVVRYKLDNLQGYNFLLENALGGGGTHSLRSDPQGKTFAQALLRQKIAVPTDLMKTL